MSVGTSSVDVEIDTGTVSVDVPPNTDEEFEMFPDERAGGPLSGVFRAAQRFRRRMGSE